MGCPHLVVFVDHVLEGAEHSVLDRTQPRRQGVLQRGLRVQKGQLCGTARNVLGGSTAERRCFYRTDSRPGHLTVLRQTRDAAVSRGTEETIHPVRSRNHGVSLIAILL